MLGVTASPASAATPFKTITSSGPLNEVIAGNDLSCQVAHTGDNALELYPSGTRPGSCGTFVFVAGTLYAPDFANHGSSATTALGTYTPWTAVSQTDVTGAGTTASPFAITTVGDAGTAGLRVTNLDTYIVGQESYRTDVTLKNNSPGALTGVIYRAGDCYLQSSDTGYGFLDAGARAVGCSINANNSPAGRIEQWYPITPGNQYMEAGFGEVWGHIATHTPFPNTTRAAEKIDNGAGISWTFDIPAGGQATFAHFTTFSPAGTAGPPAPVPSPTPTPTPAPAPRPAPPPPAPATPVPAIAFGKGGFVDAPSNRKCLSRRYFRIRLRKKFWPSIVGATVKLPKTNKVLRKPPWGTIVDLRGLPKGRFTVTITALTTTGSAITGKRKYRTCAGRLRGGKPKL